VMRGLRAGRGEMVLGTDEQAGKALELTVRKGGDIVHIRDPKTGQIWEVDTGKYRIALAGEPEGLSIELPDRGTVTLKTGDGGKLAIISGLRNWPDGRQPKPIRDRD